VIERVDKRVRLEEEIRQRLKGVCCDLEPKDFQSLIEQIADNNMKSDARVSLFRLRPESR
jgi:hypothetical protein